jgi:flagellar motor switch protein FliG
LFQGKAALRNLCDEEISEKFTIPSTLNVINQSQMNDILKNFCADLTERRNQVTSKSQRECAQAVLKSLVYIISRNYVFLVLFYAVEMHQ